jgi:hypothetical protein
MAIKFICSCGKHLRARDEMAARRSVCPRCGAPVGIPSRQPTHPGTAPAPLTPTERLRQRPMIRSAEAVLAENTPAPPSTAAQHSSRRDAADEAGSSHFAPPLGPHSTQKASAAEARPARRPALRWHPDLLYPLRAGPVVLGLAAALTVLTGGISLAWPALYEIVASAQGWVWLVPCAPCVLFPLLTVGYVCAFLDCTYCAAATGVVREVRWPGRDLGLVVRSGLIWLICFLGGPFVPAGVALVFWIRCGDPALVDWLILAELGIVAGGYWLLAVLAVHQNDRLRDANPLRVAQLVDSLGYYVVVAVIGAVALALAHGLLAFAALGELHRNPATGGLLLLASYGSGLFVATAWFRLLGAWCHRRRIVS